MGCLIFFYYDQNSEKIFSHEEFLNSVNIKKVTGPQVRTAWANN